MEEKKIPVIIDCDPGIDDALALVVAFSLPQLDIKAVTTVAGNVSVENTTRSARTVLGVMGVSSKIYKGAEGPLMGEVIEASDVHGESGIGGYKADESKLHPLESISAIEAQRKILTESETPITIVAVGPLTNIAILIKAYPEVKSKIKEISIMGGGLYSGNHTAAAEFNILADPEAASIVFKSGIPIIMAGLDVTHKATLTNKEVNDIADINTPVADMIGTMLKFSIKNWHGESQKEPKLSMHDVVSVLVLVYPEMFSGEYLPVFVETSGQYSRGYTVADVRHFSKENKNCYVLKEINHDEFINKIFKALNSY